MRFAAFLLFAIPCFAQIAGRPTAAASMAPAGGAVPVTTRAKAGRIPLTSLVALERAFDAKLGGKNDSNGPIDLFGATRGIYLDGYGVVFTTELGLVVTPTINPFNSNISEEQRTRVHNAKLQRLPILKKAIMEMMRNVATDLGQVPDTQQVVVAVRLDYLNWENTGGLPGLIVAKADRRSAIAGNFQLEEQ